MLARSLKTRIEREGFGAAIRDAFGTLLPTRFEVWRLSRKNSSTRSAAEADADMFAGPAAVESLKRHREAGSGLPVEFYRNEIDNIQSCFLACVAGRPAAIAWSYDHTKPAHFLGMSPGDAEIRSVYSLAEFRGRGLAKAVIAVACRSLFHDGFQNIYALIHFRNEASRRAFQSVGFSKVAELRRAPIFGPRYVTETEQTESWLDALGRRLRFWRFHRATPSDQR
ncbi:MAG: GNAT family N-acetyltransferase [Candidatus Acidiferrales bacterium]